MQSIVKPLLNIAKQFENVLNLQCDYFVFDTETKDYEYCTEERLLYLLNKNGVNRYIVYETKNQVNFKNEIQIIKEEI